jgi:hypothetical protein
MAARLRRVGVAEVEGTFGGCAFACRTRSCLVSLPASFVYPFSEKGITNSYRGIGEVDLLAKEGKTSNR